MREGCAIHAYVLMTNHVHLLMMPVDTGRVARVMQAPGRRYVRYVNDRYHRTGTLWEGRYKACPVDCIKCLLKLSFIDSVYADELDPSKNSRCNLFQADRSNA